jgi:hypothetical protein
VKEVKLLRAEVAEMKNALIPFCGARNQNFQIDTCSFKVSVWKGFKRLKF